jgi:hypothetical protein
MLSSFIRKLCPSYKNQNLSIMISLITVYTFSENDRMMIVRKFVNAFIIHREVVPKL